MIASRVRALAGLSEEKLDRLTLQQPGARYRPSMMSLGRRLWAEAIGTGLLLATIIGSGIMGDQLAGGNAAVALLANTLATGAGLVTLILTFGPVSGAHFNPLVSVAEAWRGGLPWREVFPYSAAQVAGAFAGVAAAHMMFGKPLFFAAGHVRAGWPLIWSEVVATFGLLCVVLIVSKTRATAVPYAVGCYISAAYWFTASTSFANPAVTLARSASNTFAGIRPDHVSGFLLGQCVGALAALALYRWLFHQPAR
jgi:glycerol uptake facilitator-like aquaporin